MLHDIGYRLQLETGAPLNLGYHASRLTPDARRDLVWQALWRYHFSKEVPTDGCVLDMGCGYGGFINNVVARRRIAIDSWPDFPRFIAAGVETIVGNVTDLSALSDGSVDFGFASNLFEHITQPDFSNVLDSLRRILSSRGTLTIVQPNYRYAYREYFDDYTHIAVYSHVSISDFLTANGYEVLSVVPRFMPLTVKSRMPVWRGLVAGYLWSPVKPLGKQMLVRARPVR
jgi:SAM-dependent methyltransferase